MSSSYDKDIIYSLHVDSIAPNPWQPRTYFDDDAVRNLARDIKENGQLQPIVVRNIEDQNRPFQLVFGQRRLSACRRLGTKVQARVRDMTDGQVIIAAFSENAQREDIDLLDEAHAIQSALESNAGLTQASIARALGYSTPQLSNRLKLLRLPANLLNLVSEKISDGKMGWTIARELFCLMTQGHVHDVELQSVYESLTSYCDSGTITRVEIRTTIRNAVLKNADNWRLLEGSEADYEPHTVHTIPYGQSTQRWTCDVETWELLHPEEGSLIAKENEAASTSERKESKVPESQLSTDTPSTETEMALQTSLQLDVEGLKFQIANQQSAIANLNAKIEGLSVASSESTTEGDIIRDLHERVLKMEPDEFERLVGEYLKAKGFSNVVVSGRSHDGGIDGECELPLIDVKVAFQAKRYAVGNNIGIDPVQRLNGSLGSSYDRGLFITTSEFTSFARGWVEEEQVKIALIDGDELVKQMVDLGLGVRTIPVIKHEVDEGFFADLESK